MFINDTVKTPAGKGTVQFGMNGGKIVVRVKKNDINWDYLEIKERCESDLEGNSVLFWFTEKEIDER